MKASKFLSIAVAAALFSSLSVKALSVSSHFPTARSTSHSLVAADTILPDSSEPENVLQAQNESGSVENDTVNVNPQSVANISPAKIVELCKLILAVTLDDGRNSEVIKASIGILIQWMTDTDKVKMEISSNTSFLFNNEDNIYLFGAYLAAETYTILTKDLHKNNADTYLISMKLVLQYYKHNRNYIPKNKLLNKWLKLDGEKLDDAIMQQYLKK